MTWSMCVCETEPVRRAHERPGLRTEVEAELELRDAPVRLHRRQGKALDGDVLVGERLDGLVHEHEREGPPGWGAGRARRGRLVAVVVRGAGMVIVVDRGEVQGRGGLLAR